jgi:hypothetical protein
MTTITLHKNAIWVILPRYDIKTNIKINYGMQSLRLWNRYLEMMRKGTRRVPIFIEKAGTISSTPEGSYLMFTIASPKKIRMGHRVVVCHKKTNILYSKGCILYL